MCFRKLACRSNAWHSFTVPKDWSGFPVVIRFFGALGRAIVQSSTLVVTLHLDDPTTLNWNLIVLVWWYLESNRGQLEGLGKFTTCCWHFEIYKMCRDVKRGFAQLFCWCVKDCTGCHLVSASSNLQVLRLYMSVV